MVKPCFINNIFSVSCPHRGRRRRRRRRRRRMVLEHMEVTSDQN